MTPESIAEGAVTRRERRPAHDGSASRAAYPTVLRAKGYRIFTFIEPSAVCERG